MRFAIALVCAWLGQAAMAAVPVTSGEHDGFSRLVLRIGGAGDWTLETDGSRAILQIEGRTDGFDLRRAFDKIPRDRLAALTDGGEGRLVLSLNCACPVNAYRFRREYLVLDISDPKPETAVETDSPTASSLVMEPPPPIDLTALPVAEVTAPPEGVAQVDARLAQFVTEAAARGVLDLAQDRAPPATHPAELPPVDNPASAAPDAPTALPPAALQVNVDPQPSVDVSLKSLAAALPALITAERCVSNAALDISAWRDDRPFAVQVGEMRARLVSEFDRPAPNAARDLARLYVAFGLGAEARAVLSVFSEKEAHPELWDLSHLLSSPTNGPATRFAHQASCDGHAALWAVLAQTPGEEDWNTTAIQRGFSALPAELRHHLAPPLAARLQAAGHHDAADAVLRVAGRGRQVQSPELALALADLSPGTPTSADTLAAEARRNSPTAPQALIDLIDMRLAAGAPPDPGWIELTAAFAREHKDTPLGDALVQRRARVLAHAAQFDSAFSPAPVSLPKPILSDMASQLTKAADDITFLKIALDPVRVPRSSLTETAARDIHQRLAALGFGLDGVSEQAAAQRHHPADGSEANRQGQHAPSTHEALATFRQWASARATPSASTGEVSLSAAREAAQRSRDARAALDDLLSATALPGASP